MNKDCLLRDILFQRRKLLMSKGSVFVFSLLIFLMMEGDGLRETLSMTLMTQIFKINPRSNLGLIGSMPSFFPPCLRIY